MGSKQDQGSDQYRERNCDQHGRGTRVLGPSGQLMGFRSDPVNHRLGLVQGGVQSLSRSLFTRIIPARQAAEFFGFYNLLGKFAAVIGPVLMGWVGVLVGDSRVSILAVGVLILGGGIILYFVDEQEGRRLALQLDLVGTG